MTTLERRLTQLEALPVGTPRPPISVRTPADIVALMETTVNDLRAGGLEARDAAVIGALAGVALKALTLSDLADRLAALEDVLEPERARQMRRR